ncbi:MAG: hypothetical protein IKS08_04780 [Alphaproteobacteria bacterium]|nr:hypothetical protein [Alphaproteobacteria bacterium]
MPDLTYEQKYAATQAKCQACLDVIQPWLMEFRAQQNKQEPGKIGTCFYEDVRVLTNPSGDYYWKTSQGQELLKRRNDGEIGLYYLMGAGSSFVIEYAKQAPQIFAYEGQLVEIVQSKPTRAYFLYTDRGTNATKFDVPLEVALAAKTLYSESEYLGALYGCMLEQKKRTF